MDAQEASWGDVSIRNPAELRALIVKLKNAVTSGEMHQFWPKNAPFGTETKITEINENSPWPSDYIEWYFLYSKNNRCYLLSAETYHGTGGNWRMID